MSLSDFIGKIESGEVSYIWSVPQNVRDECLPRLRTWAATQFDFRLGASTAGSAQVGMECVRTSRIALVTAQGESGDREVVWHLGSARHAGPDREFSGPAPENPIGLSQPLDSVERSPKRGGAG
jgi:hypothetical protein